MKNITLTALMVGFLFGIHSCCTKRECLGVHEIYDIYFYNFSQADLDTIIIISYSKNSNFTTQIDSFVTQAGSTGDPFSASTGKRIHIDLDYKIKLPSTGQVFTLTGFEIEREGCNVCFPFRPENDYYDELVGYQVNGQKQTGRQIKIYK